MMAAAVQGAEELELLERLLGLPGGNKYGVQGERKVPVLQTNNGPGLTGLMTIAAHLVRQARKDQLLGSTAEEKAVVQQWLEYRVTRVNGGSSKEDTRTILKVEAEKRISKVTLLFEQPDDKEQIAKLTVFSFLLLATADSPFDLEDYHACLTNLVKILKNHFSHLNSRYNETKITQIIWEYLPLDLNMHLEDKVYLAGNIFTLADILMYYGLHHIMVDLTVQEKEKYLNVSRWFNHIQHYPGVRQHLSDVVFIKNRLYTNAH